MSRYTPGVFVLVGLLVMAVWPVTAQEERITLEVVLTAGRNPHVNVVQDYGDVSWTQILTETFQEQYPHVDVQFRTGSTEQVTVMIASGIGPDIINGGHTSFVNLGRNGAFIDLNPLLARDGIDYVADQTYWPPQWEAFQYNGEQFALPQYLGTVAMMYNADLFAEAGVADPNPNLDENTMDWDEFESIARKLTQDVAGNRVPDVWGFNKTLRTNRVYFWMKAAGAEFYGNDEHTVSTLDSPEAMEALDYLRGLRWDAQVMPPPGVSPSWSQGEVAIMEQGSWALVDYLGSGSDGTSKIAFDWNVFPMPKGPSGERVTMATIDGYAINKNTEHLEEAYALLRFLTGPEANAIKAKYLALQPAHRDVVPDYIGLMRDMNRQAYDVNVHVFTDAGPYAHPQLLYSQQDVVNGMLNEAYTNIFDHNEPIGTVWPETIERMNRVLAASDREYDVEHIVWQDKTWATRDFNTVNRGASTVRDDQLTIQADGADIWGTRDGFRYVYHTIEGDFTATVQLVSAPDTNAWSKSGIMLRTEETAEAANIAVLGTDDNGIVMQERLLNGATSKTSGRTSWTNGQPVYLRITRMGDRVIGLSSTDGYSWTELADVEIHLPAEVLIGIASTSHAAGKPGEAVFTHWELFSHDA